MTRTARGVILPRQAHGSRVQEKRVHPWDSSRSIRVLAEKQQDEKADTDSPPDDAVAAATADGPLASNLVPMTTISLLPNLLRVLNARPHANHAWPRAIWSNLTMSEKEWARQAQEPCWRPPQSSKASLLLSKANTDFCAATSDAKKCIFII